jgi:hypothetical protein
MLVVRGEDRNAALVPNLQARTMSSSSLLSDNSFLFALGNSRAASTVARVHIRRIYDVLQVSITRDDASRARRAWSILVRCPEVNWQVLWKTAMHILDLEMREEGASMQDINLLDQLLQKPTGEVRLDDLPET